MSRKYLTILLLLVSSCAVSQVKRYKERFDNGQRKFKGRYIECVRNHPVVHGLILEEKKKFGKWIAYRPDGSIREIRNYTENVESCKDSIFREGEWVLFDNIGNPYYRRLYRNDTLIKGEIAIMESDTQVGKKLISDLHPDSILLFSVDNALIPNGGFDQYFYAATSRYTGGQEPVHLQIPFWESRDDGTPDYYNTGRGIEGISTPGLRSPGNGVVGLMLHLNKEVKSSKKSELSIFRDKIDVSNLNYTEHLEIELSQSLQKGRSYCFSLDIALSSLAGLRIDKLGVYFSERRKHYSYLQSLDTAHSYLSLAQVGTEWKTLCSCYQAIGGEKLLVVGRLSPMEEIKLDRVPQKGKDSLEIYRSAYYLIDNVKLESADDCCCQNEIREDGLSPDTVVLDDLTYELDSYKIDESAATRLKSLIVSGILDNAKSIRIIGHTDYVGSDDYNMNLSSKRASEVADWMIENGIKRGIISWEGKGSSEPVIKADTANPKNRRVEILIFK